MGIARNSASTKSETAVYIRFMILKDPKHFMFDATVYYSFFVE